MKQPSTGEARRQEQNVVNFDRSKIDGVVIQNGDEKIEIRRHDNKWRIETPFKDQADGALVENLLSDLETWQKEGTIPAKDIDADKSKLNEYGLNRPKLKLKLIGSYRPPEILFGKDAALEGRMYVRFENSKETFLAKQSVKKDIDKKRKNSETKINGSDHCAGAPNRVKTPAGEMELEKKGDHWDIVKPLRARADDEKVGDLIAQVTTARIQQFVADDHGDLRPYGLAEPRGSITLFGQEGKETKRLRSLTRLKSLARRTKVKCCKSAACLRRKRIRYMSGSLLAGPFTLCPRRLKRSSTLSQPIYATIIWFGLTQTFSIESRSMFQ